MGSTFPMIFSASQLERIHSSGSEPENSLNTPML